MRSLTRRPLAVLLSLVVVVATLSLTDPVGAARGKVATTVGWAMSARSANVGDTLTVTGSAAPFRDVAPRTARLQALPAGTRTWVTLDSTTADRDGRFRLATPLTTAGRYDIRVLVVGTRRARQKLTAPRSLSVLRRPTSMTASWPARVTHPKKRAFVTGRVSPWQGRSVVVQRRVPGGWVSHRSVRLTSPSYRLQLPDRAYGRFQLRVVSPLTAAYTAGSRQLGGHYSMRPTYDPVGPAGDFRYYPGSAVARWNPCQTIDYRVNARNARTPGGLADVKEAVRRISLATGLELRYRGTSTKIPRQSATQDIGDGVDLLISWAWKSQTDFYGDNRPEDVLGLGAPYYDRRAFRDGAGRAVRRILQGRIVMNPRFDDGYLKRGAGPGRTRVAVVMHEIGHTLGLLHAEHPSQIMAPEISRRPDLWGAGDLTGLRRLGWTQGCISPTSSARMAAHDVPLTPTWRRCPDPAPDRARGAASNGVAGPGRRLRG